MVQYSFVFRSWKDKYDKNIFVVDLMKFTVFQPTKETLTKKQRVKVYELLVKYQDIFTTEECPNRRKNTK